MTTVGFIGLGHMGGTMAARFLATGYAVSSSRRSPTTTRSSPSRPGVTASSPAWASGKLWVDVSTISPRASRALAAQAHERRATMLDALVSGSVPQVQAGTLTIMVDGDEEAYARVEPALRVLGTPTRIGDNGQGLVLKLAINVSRAVQMLAFSEGLLLAERDGIDPRLAAEVMTDSAIGSPMLKARAPLVLDLPDDAWFDVGLMRKDIRLALAAARERDVALPSAGVADDVLARAAELGYEHRDIAAIFRVLGRIGE
jgi:3-hydroxyisobutyrate dehydrogenase-like beta-hydroxyacid dehydrogenase